MAQVCRYGGYSDETKGMGSEVQGYESTVSLSKGHDKLFVCVNVLLRQCVLCHNVIHTTNKKITCIVVCLRETSPVCPCGCHLMLVSDHMIIQSREAHPLHVCPLVHR